MNVPHSISSPIPFNSTVSLGTSAPRVEVPSPRSSTGSQAPLSKESRQLTDDAFRSMNESSSPVSSDIFSFISQADAWKPAAVEQKITDKLSYVKVGLSQCDTGAKLKSDEGGLSKAFDKALNFLWDNKFKVAQGLAIGLLISVVTGGLAPLVALGIGGFAALSTVVGYGIFKVMEAIFVSEETAEKPGGVNITQASPNTLSITPDSQNRSSVTLASHSGSSTTPVSQNRPSTTLDSPSRSSMTSTNQSRSSVTSTSQSRSSVTSTNSNILTATTNTLDTMGAAEQPVTADAKVGQGSTPQSRADLSKSLEKLIAKNNEEVKGLQTLSTLYNLRDPNQPDLVKVQEKLENLKDLNEELVQFQKLVAKNDPSDDFVIEENKKNLASIKKEIASEKKEIVELLQSATPKMAVPTPLKPTVDRAKYEAGIKHEQLQTATRQPSQPTAEIQSSVLSTIDLIVTKEINLKDENSRITILHDIVQLEMATAALKKLETLSDAESEALKAASSFKEKYKKALQTNENEEIRWGILQANGKLPTISDINSMAAFHAQVGESKQSRKIAEVLTKKITEFLLLDLNDPNSDIKANEITRVLEHLRKQDTFKDNPLENLISNLIDHFEAQKLVTSAYRSVAAPSLCRKFVAAHQEVVNQQHKLANLIRSAGVEVTEKEGLALNKRLEEISKKTEPSYHSEIQEAFEKSGIRSIKTKKNGETIIADLSKKISIAVQGWFTAGLFGKDSSEDEKRIANFLQTTLKGRPGMPGFFHDYKDFPITEDLLQSLALNLEPVALKMAGNEQETRKKLTESLINILPELITLHHTIGNTPDQIKENEKAFNKIQLTAKKLIELHLNVDMKLKSLEDLKDSLEMLSQKSPDLAQRTETTRDDLSSLLTNSTNPTAWINNFSQRHSTLKELSNALPTTYVRFGIEAKFREEGESPEGLKGLHSLLSSKDPSNAANYNTLQRQLEKMDQAFDAFRRSIGKGNLKKLFPKKEDSEEERGINLKAKNPKANVFNANELQTINEAYINLQKALTEIQTALDEKQMSWNDSPETSASAGRLSQESAIKPITSALKEIGSWLTA